MPPKPKFTKEEVLRAAMEIVRRQGAEALTARELGKALNASPRPIFTLFESMEEVRREIQKHALALFERMREQETASSKYPGYLALGMAYLRLAKEEKKIFQLLFMQDRSNDPPGGIDSDAVARVRRQTGLPEEAAERFHLEMWVCTHGIATMLATSYLDWSNEQIQTMLTDYYEGLKYRFAQAEKQEEL